MTARIIVLILVIGAIVGSIVYLEHLKAPRPDLSSNPPPVIPLTPTNEVSASSSTPGDHFKTVAEKAREYPRAIELVNPSGFINAQPFKIADLVGKKAIMVDFWTYSCINCQRTLPYLNAWYDKYKNEGLEIIGVHTPEFGFEKIKENVAQAVSKYGIKYPVVQDNDYATWSAYQNLYWPHKYLIDVDGFVVYDHIGEGSYDETERKIQELLIERAARINATSTVAQGIVAPKNAIAVDAAELASPETYFGAARNEFLVNGTQGTVGVQELLAPGYVQANKLYVVGKWNFDREYAENISAGASILFKYNAKNVYFVASGDAPVTVTVLRDGKPLGAAAGADIKLEGASSTVTVKESRLYKIIEDPAGYGEHTLELHIEKPGLKAFTFTFG